MPTSGSDGALCDLPSRAWSCDTLARGVSFVVANASKMQMGDYSNLPDDAPAAELAAAGFALLRTLAMLAS